MISFTGSTNVGRHIGQIAAKNFKKVSLEVIEAMNMPMPFIFMLSLVGRQECSNYI